MISDHEREAAKALEQARTAWERATLAAAVEDGENQQGHLLLASAGLERASRLLALAAERTALFRARARARSGGVR